MGPIRAVTYRAAPLPRQETTQSRAGDDNGRRRLSGSKDAHRIVPIVDRWSPPRSSKLSPTGVQPARPEAGTKTVERSFVGPDSYS
jgi:hypothetical protein